MKGGAGGRMSSGRGSMGKGYSILAVRLGGAWGSMDGWTDDAMSFVGATDGQRAGQGRAQWRRLESAFDHAASQSVTRTAHGAACPAKAYALWAPTHVSFVGAGQGFLSCATIPLASMGDISPLHLLRCISIFSYSTGQPYT